MKLKSSVLQFQFYPCICPLCQKQNHTFFCFVFYIVCSSSFICAWSTYSNMQPTYLIILIHATDSYSNIQPTYLIILIDLAVSHALCELDGGQFWESKKGPNFTFFFHPFDFNFEVKNPWIPLIFISFMWSFDSHKTREISTFHSFYSYPHFHRLSFTQNEQILRMCLFAGKESVKWEKLKVKWCGINTLTIYFNSKFFISVDFVSNSFHPIEGILR